MMKRSIAFVALAISAAFALVQTSPHTQPPETTSRPADGAPGAAISFSPAASQTVIQPPGTSFNVNILNGILNAFEFSGADIGAKINNAIAAAGPNGGDIYVPASVTCYTFTTPILLAPNIHLRGAGRSATCLKYTATTGTALTAAAYASIENLTLLGPPSASSTTGIMIAAQSFTTNHIILGGFDHSGTKSYFHTGMTFGKNAYALGFYEMQIWQNDQNVLFPSGLSNAGEDIKFIGGSVTNSNSLANCFQSGAPGVPNNAEFEFVGTSFDGCQVVNNEGIMRMHGVHFEDVGIVYSIPFMKTYGSNLTGALGMFGTFIDGATIYNDTKPVAHGQFEVDRFGALYVNNLMEGGNSQAIPLFYLDELGNGRPYLKFEDAQNQRSGNKLFALGNNSHPILNISTPAEQIHTTAGNSVTIASQTASKYGQGQAIVQSSANLGLYYWTGKGSTWNGVQLQPNDNGTGFNVCATGAFSFSSYESLGTEKVACVPLSNTTQRIITTSSAESETISWTNLTPSSVCTFSADDALAASNLGSAYIRNYSAGSFTFAHAARAGMHYAVTCSNP
jgi:hypothetical protein